MNPKDITLCSFTNVYDGQPNLKAATSLVIDCSDIGGTDCYCDDEAVSAIQAKIAGVSVNGIHFFDSGNYHYMSKLWTDKIQEPFNLLIFDHHPDMQPPRFEGILSCGGWVKEVLEKNSFVQKVIVVGIADKLISDLKGDEAAEFSKFEDRVEFIAESEIREGDIVEKDIASDPFTAGNQVAEKLAMRIKKTLPQDCPTYISIDKDVLRKEDAATNWDQGSLSLQMLCGCLQALCNTTQILGVDICGERGRDMDFTEAAAADALNEKASLNILKALSS
ncbi:MAG: arginase family protein [Fibrobacter sp.]|nr:arginase family protein [Fibrobacter sp.]